MAASNQPLEQSALSQTPFAWDQWLMRVYALNWEYILYGTIFIFAFITRFYGLGDRVMSHDESLHTYYSWRLYDAGDFQHTPLMHGPLLFHANAFFYFLFGDSDFSARIYTALLGVLVVMFPFLYRRWLGKTGAVLASIGLMISPMMLYYNRYIRHDTPNIFFGMVMIYALLQYVDGERPRRPVWMWVASGSMLLMLASKETAFIYIAIIGTFFALYWFLRLIQETPLKFQHRPHFNLSWQAPAAQTAIGHILVFIIAVILGYLVSHLLYYWTFAEVSWLWLLVGLVSVLLLRLLPLTWEVIQRAISGEINLLYILLLFIMALGLLISLEESFRYQSLNSDLSERFVNGVFIATPDAETPEVIENARDEALYFAIGGLIQGLFMLIIFAALNRRSPEDGGDVLPINQWMLETFAIALGVTLFITILRLLSRIDFELGDPLVTVVTIATIGFLLEGFGVVRSLIARQSRAGVSQLLTEGLARPKSAVMIIIAGTVLGGVFAVYMFGMLDIIRPDQIWTYTTLPENATGITESGEIVANPVQETILNFDTSLGNALLTWTILPLLAVFTLLFTVATLTTPRSMPFPWADLLGVILIATIVGGVFVYFERHSLEDTDAVADEPVAIDPNAEAGVVTETNDNTIIIGTMLLFLLASTAVVGWRSFFPEHWEYFNRQPAFDVLIVVASLILPWASAFPIFAAGYTLDQAPLPEDTMEVSILVTGSFLIFSAVVGLAWNWRVWLVSNLVFLAFFVFFFTTVFSNGAGVFTGMVGSLGYWLEQQGVRRGSQPQYYYTLVQVPIYEFMPAILATLAGIAGLRELFQWRNRSHQIETNDALDREMADTNPIDMSAIIQEQKSLAEIRDSQEAPAVHISADTKPVISDPEAFEAELRAQQYESEEFAILAEWRQPYNHQIELIKRQRQAEWLGEFPFMLFIAYWAMFILLALTLAGEKMPWLTTHITLPLILGGSWYAGRIIEKIEWSALRRGGWALLLFLMPVFVVSLLRAFGPLLGNNPPFQGQGQAELNATNEWLASVVVFMASTFFLVRIGEQVGWAQTRRITFASVVMLLGFLTARVAFIASYLNYDYPTEFLVYAHSGPAVKLALDEIDDISDRINEGEEMKVAYDDDSSWPMTWYMRDQNAAFFAGDSSSFESNPGAIDGARVVVVGNRKNDAVERILGDSYYRFDYKRLWWPMQEYFHLTYNRISNMFDTTDNPAAELYRQGIWDIWWNRDFDTYAQAQCVEGKQSQCVNDTNQNACYVRVANECKGDSRYDLTRWPVSDNMYVYVDKEIAAEIWDAGIGGQSVASRDPLSVVDRVYRDLIPLTTFGADTELSGPRGIGVAADGTVYVADTDNSRIQVYSALGQYLRTIGYPSTQENSDPGSLFQPWGVEVGPDGNIYVADTWNHRVQVFNPEGGLLAAWGQYGVVADGDTSEYGLWGPRDITLDLEGNVLVADTGNKRIRVYSSDGTWLRDLGTGGSNLGQLDEPVGLAVNPVSGEIYVADTWNRRIQIFSNAGVALRTFEVPMWFDSRSSPDRPYLAVSPDGSLLAVSDMNATGRNDGPRVVVYDLAGNAVLAFNAPETDVTAGLHGLRIVADMAFALDGSLYALDSQTGRVVKFPPLPTVGSLAPNPLEDVNPLVVIPGENNSSEGVGNPIGPDVEIPFSVDATQEVEE